MRALVAYIVSICVTEIVFTVQVLLILDVACGKPARRRYCMHGCKVQSAPSAASVHAYSYIQQSGRSVKTMNAKNTKKSPRMRTRT